MTPSKIRVPPPGYDGQAAWPKQRARGSQVRHTGQPERGLWWLTIRAGRKITGEMIQGVEYHMRVLGIPSTTPTNRWNSRHFRRAYQRTFSYTEFIYG